MEEGKSILTEYEPFDTSNIKAVYVRSEKELEAEAASICELLKDIKSDWDKRLKAILSIQQFVVSEQVRCLSNFFQFMSKLVGPLTQQLTDLRSQITKEASKAISLMAQVLQQDFELLAPKFISKNSLYKLLNSAKHIMAEHSHICIIAILNNVVAPKVIPNIHEEVRSRNPQVRIKNAEYIYIILTIWPEDSVVNYVNQVEDLITHLIGDAKAEARQIARLAYFRYKEIFPERANSVFQHVDAQHQKAITDDEEQLSFGGSPSVRPMELSQKSKSPQKYLRPARETVVVQGGQTNDSLGVPSNSKNTLKQSRSVSRGRPNTASNNLSQKATGVSPVPIKKQMRSPRLEDTQSTKKALFDVEACQKPQLQQQKSQELELPPATEHTFASPKIDTSKLKLLKSPKLSQPISSKKELKVITNFNQNQNDMEAKPLTAGVSQKNPIEINQYDSIEVNSACKQGNQLGSPGLPPEKQQQLRNLKEKKLKQSEESQQQNYNSVPVASAQQRGSLKSPNQISTLKQLSSQNNLVLHSTMPVTKRPSRIVPQKTREEVAKMQKTVKRQKSASPAPESPKSALIKNNNAKKEKESGPPQSLKQLKLEKQGQSAQSNTDFLNPSHPPAQRVISPTKKPTKAKTSKLQVSQSISNFSNTPSRNNSFRSKRDDCDNKSNLHQFEEQKIFEELDFINSGESIDTLIVSAQSVNWEERLKSFNLIQKSEDQLQDCSDQLIKKLFKVHIDYLDDEKPRVVKAVQDSFMKLIQYQKHLLDKYLDQIVPVILTNMVSQVESVSVSSSDLINLICLYSKPSDLVLILMDLLRDQKNNLKVVTAGLEVLVVLLKDDIEYCLKNANVLETCLKIVELLEVNQNNMDVIMPSIAVLLAMRDKNFEGTMKALVFLKSNQLALVRKLASQFAPDFDHDITQNVLNEYQSLSKQSPNVKQSQDQFRWRQSDEVGLKLTKNKSSSATNHRKEFSNIEDKLGNLKDNYSKKEEVDDQITMPSFIKKQRASSIEETVPEDEHTPMDRFSQSLMNFSQHPSQKESPRQNSKISAQHLQLVTNEENICEPTLEREKNSPKRIESRIRVQTQSDQSMSPMIKQHVNEEDEEEEERDDDEEQEHKVDESFSNLIAQTQISQQNYIISKAGDTVDDIMDDGVTPTPSKRMQGDTNGSGEARHLKSETFSSESKYQQEIRDILEQSQSNRKDFIQSIQGLLKDANEEVWENCFEDVTKTLFEIFKDEESSNKDMAITTLQQIVLQKPQQVSQHLPEMLEDLAGAYSNNKKMSNAFDEILLALDSTQDKRELFNILNDKLADQENPNLQMHIKFCSFLLKSQPMTEVEEYFSIVFNNFYALMGHTSANVRKGLVFCMVNMYFLMDKETYEHFLSKFNANQRKLVTIYVERKAQNTE